MPKYNVTIETPDFCAECGERLPLGSKKSKKGEGKAYTIIEEICPACKKTHKLTIKTKLDSKFLQFIRELAEQN